MKYELVSCLMAVVKDRSSEEYGSDEEWTIMMDRGGLWPIKETTYTLFLAIEEEIRDCLKSNTKFLKRYQQVITLHMNIEHRAKVLCKIWLTIMVSP